MNPGARNYKETRQEIVNDLLSYLSKNPDEAKTSALIGVEMDKPADWVEFWIERARMDGHLVIECERGFYLAPTYEHFDAWRKAYVIPKLAETLDMLTSMGKQAKRQFNREDLPDSILPILTG